MGVPKQDVWIAHNLDRLDVGVAVGVGGLFDFYSGRTPKAPVWMREAGLEWFWRFEREPKQMFSRSLIGNSLFLARVWSWYAKQSKNNVANRFQRFSDPSGYQSAKFRLAMRKLLWRVGRDGTLMVKRAMDVVGAGAGLGLLSPVFLATAAAIKMEDGGPVFYSATRVGRRGQEFDFYKFRSMVIDASKQRDALLDKNESGGGVIFKMKQDPRITRVGAFIRRYSIDELPQLYNVLRGDMSLVGPRPPLPKEVEQYKIGDRYRLEVIPGLTCIWQTSGRSKLDFNTQVKLDTDYIKEQSFVNDLVLIIKTVPAVFSGQGAY
jgi:lipopolysaccharide/colanic/teichoic acid biosynthesis glycosyltransferase